MFTLGEQTPVKVMMLGGLIEEQTGSGVFSQVSLDSQRDQMAGTTFEIKGSPPVH